MSESDERDEESLPAQIDPSSDSRVGSSTPFADFIRNLPPGFEEVLRGAEGNPQMMSFFATAFSASHYSGPLPPPDQLKAYESVLPGAADRIIRMAENQAEHRQSIEKIAVKGGNSRSWWGLFLGFSIAVIALGASALLVLKGHSAAGITIASIDIVGLAAVFVYGKADQRRERIQKESQTKLPSRELLTVSDEPQTG